MTLIEWLIVRLGVLTGNSEWFSDDEADCGRNKNYWTVHAYLYRIASWCFEVMSFEIRASCGIVVFRFHLSTGRSEVMFSAPIVKQSLVSRTEQRLTEQGLTFAL